MNYNEKYELIDLSQEIYQGMPVFGMHQKTFIMTNQTHEENMKQTGSKTLGFSARNLLISEHGPTHSDAVWEYNPEGPTIDKMDMKLFYGSAICVDLTHIRYPDYIEAKDLEEAVEKAGLTVEKGDIFLMYTGHYNRTYAKGDIEGYQNYYTGLSYEAAEWLAKKGVVNIGVVLLLLIRPRMILIFRTSGMWKIWYDHTENLRNLDLVAGKRFFYMGLPLRIRDGSGSPVRAVALVEK